MAGQIEFGEFLDLDGLAVKYDFVAGEDWNHCYGALTGTSQHAYKGQGAINKRIVWSLPFEAAFRTMTPFGWPQLVIYCNGKDSRGKEIVLAYGCIHIPIGPGIHKKTVRMFAPIAKGHKCKEFFGTYVQGEGMSFNAPELIAKAEGREISKVKAGGKVLVTLHVTQRNMDRHGYITTNVKK